MVSFVDHGFKDEPLFYRFYLDVDPEKHAHLMARTDVSPSKIANLEESDSGLGLKRKTTPGNLSDSSSKHDSNFVVVVLLSLIL